jgi:hypothetical protein
VKGSQPFLSVYSHSGNTEEAFRISGQLFNTVMKLFFRFLNTNKGVNVFSVVDIGSNPLPIASELTQRYWLLLFFSLGHFSSTCGR